MAILNAEEVAMQCPKCDHPIGVKNGWVKGAQRYKCKECGCQYTREIPRGRPLRDKLLAVTLYTHGLSLNAIGKLLGVSTPGILDWVRRYARKHYTKLEPQGDAVILELDEMWHYPRLRGGRLWGKNPKALDLESAG